MAEHKHGEMDITTQTETFHGFVGFTVKTVIAIIVILLFLAVFAT